MTVRVLSQAILESHVGILGKTGSGKSNLAKTVVEGLLDEGARVCVIDPTGTWYGLRLTRDRKPSPYPVVMFGGTHADIVIGRTHGAAVAETIGTTSTPAVIDTRTMTVGERTEFFTAFAETLLQRNRGPLHLVVDEAHLFAPQGRVNDPKSGAMVHAANNLVALGRGIGLRIILVSQRPAKLHKDSLTQVETLVAMRLIAPQDRRAIGDWVEEWADRAQGAEVVASLPSLKTGEAWIWAPGEGQLERVKVPLARTLDTGKPSDEPIELSSIDVDAVKERLGEADATALANDPRELRKRIAELERAVKTASDHASVIPEPEVRVERVEVPVLNGQVGDLRDVVRELSQVGDRFAEVGVRILDKADAIVAAIDRVTSAPKPAPHAIPAPGKPVAAAAAASAPARSSGNLAERTPAPSPSEPASLGKAERSILAALASYPTGLTRKQLAFLAEYHPNAKGFTNAIGSLRSAGLISSGFPAIATRAGVAAAPAPDALEGYDLVEYWLSRFGRAERAILTALIDAYPGSIERAELASIAGYEHPNSKGYTNALGRLRVLGLVAGFALDPDFAALMGR